MIVEMRTYTLRPGTTGEFLKIYEEFGLPAQLPILGTLVGYYSTEFGPLNQVIHMWGYESFAERTRRRVELVKSQAWLDYLPKNRDKIVSQKNKLLVPTGFFDAGAGPMRA